MMKNVFVIKPHSTLRILFFRQIALDTVAQQTNKEEKENKSKCESHAQSTNAISFFQRITKKKKRKFEKREKHKAAHARKKNSAERNSGKDFGRFLSAQSRCV